MANSVTNGRGRPPSHARAAAEPELGPGAALIGVDLAGRDLSNLDLSGADLSGADLSGARLINTVLTGASMFRTNLSGAHLLGADLSGCDLTEADATGAVMGSATLDDAVLFGADLTGTTLTDASLCRVDARSSTLVDVRLRGARLIEAELRSTDLTGADLSGSEVRGADFGAACLRRADLRGLVGYTEAQWLGVDISEVDFTGAYALRRWIMDENYLHEFRESSRANALIYAVWKLTSNCGRSLTRWAVLTATMAIGFALAYSQVTIDYGDYETSLSPLYFSIVTLTTLGYGDVLPASTGAQAVVLVQVLIGYVLLGGLLSIFATKMGRRAE